MVLCCSPTLFSETGSLSQAQISLMGLVLLASLLWGTLSLHPKTEITGGFLLPSDVYVGFWCSVLF